jgi:preprotein translocase subunit SecA
VSYSGGVGTTQPSALAEAAEEAPGEQMLPPVVEQRRVADVEQIGRNDPCWCGSGKKYKRCHGA